MKRRKGDMESVERDTVSSIGTTLKELDKQFAFDAMKMAGIPDEDIRKFFEIKGRKVR